MKPLDRGVIASILAGRRSFGSIKFLIDLINQASRVEGVISLGGGVPGVDPPLFLINERERLLRTKALKNYLFNYTESEGILECRLAAALDTLDFCGYLDFGKQFGERPSLSQSKLEKAAVDWGEERRRRGPLLIDAGDSLATASVKPEEVNQLWRKTIGKSKNWQKRGLTKDVWQYFYLYPGSTNAFWDIISIIIRKVVGRSNSAVLTEPTYLSYLEPVLDNVGKIEWVPLDDAYFKDTGRYRPDLSLLEKKISHSKAFFLLSPSNPTGAIYDKQTIVDIVKIVNDAGAVLISDDAYRHLTYDKESTEEVQFAFKYVTEHAHHLIRTTTMSKEASSPGSPMGYVMTNVRQIIELYKEKISTRRISMSGLDQASMAAFFGYRLYRRDRTNFLVPDKYFYLSQKRYVAHVQETYREKRNYLVTQLMDELGLRPGVDFVMPQGALYVFPNLEKLMNEAYGEDVDFLRAYRELRSDYPHLISLFGKPKSQRKIINNSPCMRYFNDMQHEGVKVVMIPGILFGPSLGTFYRMTFATVSKDQIKEAINRIKEHVVRKKSERMRG